jgi:hypothetical protein
MPGPGPLRRRLLWFVGLWLAGVVAVTVVAAILREILVP